MQFLPGTGQNFTRLLKWIRGLNCMKILLHKDKFAPMVNFTQRVIFAQELKKVLKKKQKKIIDKFIKN